MLNNLENKSNIIQDIISGKVTPKFHAVNYSSPEKQKELRELYENGKREIQRRKDSWYKAKDFRVTI